MENNRTQLDIRLKLFALWLFVLLNIIFRDIHQLTLKSHLEMLLTGYFNGTKVTDNIMLFGAIVVNIPIGMLLITIISDRRLNKVLNVFAAIILALTFFMAPPTDLDDTFHLIVELIALASIVYTAVKWKKVVFSTNAV